MSNQMDQSLKEMGVRASVLVNLLGSNNCLPDIQDCMVAQSCISKFHPTSGATTDQMKAALICMHQLIIKTMPRQSRECVLNLEQRATFGHQVSQLEQLLAAPAQPATAPIEVIEHVRPPATPADPPLATTNYMPEQALSPASETEQSEVMVADDHLVSLPKKRKMKTRASVHTEGRM